MANFTLGTYSNIEFGVHLDDDGGRYSLVPVDLQVKAALEEMLTTTLRAMHAAAGDNNFQQYEPSQKYSQSEGLRLPLASPLCDGPRDLYNANNIPTDAGVIERPTSIEYYFAVFHDNGGEKLLAVRRATQFKGIVGARNRVMRVLNDSLQMFTDPLFKLDYEFDYIVVNGGLWILHPAGFEYTASIEQHMTDAAVQTAQQLHVSVPCVDFECLVNFVQTHKRAARLLASLRTRDDLPLTSLAQLKVLCESVNVQFNEANGRIGPVIGQELDFLMVLDRRRYHLSLIDGVDERYEAANRRITL